METVVLPCGSDLLNSVNRTAMTVIPQKTDDELDPAQVPIIDMSPSPATTAVSIPSNNSSMDPLSIDESPLEKGDSNTSTNAIPITKPSLPLGVGNRDVDWLARGTTLRANTKGTRSRSSSLSKSLSPTSSIAPTFTPSSSLFTIPSAPEADLAQSENTEQSHQHALNTTDQTPAFSFNKLDHVPSRRSSTATSPLARLSVESKAQHEQPDNVNYHSTASPNNSPPLSRRSSWFQSLGSKFSKNSVSHSPHPSISGPSSSHIATATVQVPKQQAPIKIPTVHEAPTGSALSAQTSPLATSPPSVSSPQTSLAHANAYNPYDSLHSHVLTKSIDESGNKSGFFSNLRRLSRSPHPNSRTASPTSSIHERVILNKNNSRTPTPIPGLDGSKLRHVAFNLKTFQVDPPQQIPARNPKKGNVTFGPTGMILGHEKSTFPSSVASSYRSATAAASHAAYDSAVIVSNMVKCDLARERKNPGAKASRSISNDSADDCFDDHSQPTAISKGLKIDTPMHASESIGKALDRNKIRSENKDGSSSSSSLESGELSEEDKLDLKKIYTRCCHLREILPIPATLRQLEGKQWPLEVLRMMNPRPTLIEIYSFADFLTVVPIRHVILDNTTLTALMFKLIFAALLHADQIVQFSARNVILEPESWQLFCAFLASNKSLSKLDISMDHSKKTNNPIPEDDSDGFTEVEAKTFRSQLDWSLFLKAIISRGGIEELLINGCLVPSELFEDLILKGVALSTRRLGVACCDLQKSDILILSKWIEDASSVCEGVDFGGNDLSTCLDYLSTSIANDTSMIYLSLNSTSLNDVPKICDIFTRMAAWSKLKFLDLSSNPDLFPEFSPYLAKLLPKFRELRRLHLDSNKLKSDDMLRLCEGFSASKSLVHLSLLDNPELDAASYEVLTTAIQLSDTIYHVDVDSTVNPTIRRRITHYCMENMQALIDGTKKVLSENDVELSDEAEELVETGRELAKAVEQWIESNDDSTEHTCGMIAKALVARAKALLNQVRLRLDELLKKRSQGEELGLDAKELIIRLYFLEANLEKVLEDYDIKNGLFHPSFLQHSDDHSLLVKQSKEQENAKEILYPHLTEHLFSIHNNKAKPLDPIHPEFTVNRVVEKPVTSQDGIISYDNREEEDGEEAGPLVELPRRPSQTSLHDKKQRQEEGEFHKLGTLLSGIRNSDPAKATANIPASTLQNLAFSSGEELRQAFLSAKGTGNIRNLIERIRKVDSKDLEQMIRTIMSQLSNPEQNEKDGEPSSGDEEILDTFINDLSKVRSRDVDYQEGNSLDAVVNRLMDSK